MNRIRGGKMPVCCEYLTLRSCHELVRALIPLRMLFKQPAHLVVNLLPVLDARKEDAETVTIILEIRGFIVYNKKDLIILSERVLFVFPPHIPLPLFLCRRGIFAVITKDSHGVPV